MPHFLQNCVMIVRLNSDVNLPDRSSRARKPLHQIDKAHESFNHRSSEHTADYVKRTRTQPTDCGLSERKDLHSLDKPISSVIEAGFFLQTPELLNLKNTLQKEFLPETAIYDMIQCLELREVSPSCCNAYHVLADINNMKINFGNFDKTNDDHYVCDTEAAQYYKIEDYLISPCDLYSCSSQGIEEYGDATCRADYWKTQDELCTRWSFNIGHIPLICRSP